MDHARTPPPNVRTLADGSTEVDLAAVPESVRAARGCVRDTWPDLDADVLADAALVVTELVTNAVRYGEPEIVLRLHQEASAIDIAVVDRGALLPPTELAELSVESDGGRGLAIVAALARSWGVDPLPDGPGKSVWASIATSG